MSRPAALVVAGPGTNRDTDALLALDLAGAEPAVVLAGELAERPELLDAARIVVVAGGFSYGDALGAGRMLALDLTVGRRRAARRAAARVRRRRPPGDRHLQRLPGAHPHRPAARRARPQRRTAASTAGGSPCARSRPAAASGRPASTTTCTARSPTARAATSTPTPTGSPPPGRSPCATDANPNGSVADIAGVCDPSGVVLGLMPHPENHVIPRQHPRHRHDPATTRTLGLRLFEAAVRHVK